MKRIVITGSSGYIGRKLVTAFRESGNVVLGIDLSAAEDDRPDVFHAGDIRDDNLLNVISEFDADTIIHSAFVIKQLHNGTRMADINMGGTKNIVRILGPGRWSSFTSVGEDHVGF